MTREAPNKQNIYARLAEYLRYQQDIAGNALLASQAKKLYQHLKQQEAREETHEQVEEASGTQNTPTNAPEPHPSSPETASEKSSTNKTSAKSKKNEHSALPTIEKLRSSTTGRLPWEEAEDEDPTPTSEQKIQGMTQETPPEEVPPQRQQASTSTKTRHPQEIKKTPGEQRNPSTSHNRESLEDIRRALGDCKRCSLCRERSNIVFGVGNPDARLMFIGEAPGYNEDAQGEPFVGKAGKLLDNMIVAMGLSREEVYIANVLKCRPPNNRNPKDEEVKQCEPFLKRQILSVSPEVIITLGRFAGSFIAGKELRITRERGQWQERFGIKVMPTYHPSYLLRKPGAKGETWKDLQTVMKTLDLPGKGA